MPRLESDIPKFLNNSRAFGDEHKKWWAEFFASRSNFYALTEKPSTWHLDELIARKMHQDEEEATPEGTVASTSNEINSNTACNEDILIPSSASHVEHDSQSLAADQPTRRPSSANPTASTLRPPNISDNIVSMVSNQFAAVPEVNILFLHTSQ